MQAIVVIALVLHVVTGVFWAGSTFALARMDGNQAREFLRPQLGAAATAIATGALLWYLLHRGSEGMSEHVLATGAIFALIAAGIQAATGLTGRQVVNQLAGVGELDGTSGQNRALTGQRIAAGCLLVTVICMAAARYF
jgi:hypothetical protein